MNYFKRSCCVAWIALSLFSFGSIAQENKEKEIEIKDQKFIFSNNICLITKKEQEDAKEYIISAQEKEIVPIKVALIILQLRTINNTDFKSLQCSLRYFVERYNEYADRNGRRSYMEQQGPVKAIVTDYTKLLEKLRTDVKYKVEFEKNIVGSNDFNFYYDVVADNPGNYEIIDAGLARKLYTDHMINKKKQGFINPEEWQLFFDLFYVKNIAPSKELSNFIKSALTKQSTGGFISIYLNSVNELAYNDMFRSIFEGMSLVNGQLPFVDSYNVSLLTIKGIMNSKYVPDTYKCSYAREIVSKNATKISKEDLIEVKKIEMPCLKEALVDADKFIIPETGCPLIEFDKSGDHKRLLSKMSGDFFKNWTDCRKKCSAGDKCTFVNEPNGQYSFYNSKYDSDLSLLKEMQGATNFSRSEPLALKYEIKPASMCVNNQCAEKMAGCADSDILKKINEELSKNKMQNCHKDADCFVMGTTLNCAKLATNVNLSFPGQNMPYHGDMASRPMIPTMQGSQYAFYGPNNFVKNRIQKLSEQCGRYGSGNQCQDTTITKAKCEKNTCVLIKE